MRMASYGLELVVDAFTAIVRQKAILFVGN